MMRITNKMMINDSNFNLQNNLRRMSKLQEQLETGKKLNRPSDNPADIVKALRLRTNITESSQYVRNMKDGVGFLETTDAALEEVTQILQRLREQVVYAGTDSNGPLERDAICREVAQLRQQLVTVANSSYGSKFLFAGSNVTEKPCVEGESWKGNADALLIEIGVGITFPINTDMSKFFGSPTGVDGGGAYDDGIFAFMLELEKNLTTLDADGQTLNADGIRGSLDELDGKINELLTQRATIGAKMNRLELQMNRMEDLEVSYTEMLSDAEDADLAEVITWLNMQESVYKASLAASARIIQPTLIDFLS